MKKIISVFLVILLIYPINISKAYDNYTLTETDGELVETLVEKIELIIDKKGEDYRELIIEKFSLVLESDEISSRIKTIIETTINEIFIYTQEELIYILESQDMYDEIDSINNEIDPVDNNNDDEIEYNYSYNESETIYSSESVSSSNISSTYDLEDIEVSDVITNWLSRNNETREDLGLDDYSYNYTLESSALSRSEQAVEAGEISHQRYEDSSYYDYDEITERFSDQGVVCENIDGITHTENIWWGAYSCSDGECTDELDISVRNAFNYYMAEEGTDSDAHYRSLVQENFNSIGIGIQIDTISSNYYEYYLTIHYCTNLQ